MLRDLLRERMISLDRGGRSVHRLWCRVNGNGVLRSESNMNRQTHPNNSNAFRATYPRKAEVRPRRLGLAVLNFPPILVARYGTLRRPSHQMKSRSRWRRPSRALELNEEG